MLGPTSVEMMRIIICGSRYTEDSVELRNRIRHEIEALSKYMYYTEIVHGCAKGADTIGGIVGQQYAAKVTKIPADWAKHGRAAGPKRNQKMLDYAMEKPCAVIAIQLKGQTKGTQDMIQRARIKNVPVIVIDNLNTNTSNLNKKE